MNKDVANRSRTAVSSRRLLVSLAAAALVSGITASASEAATSLIATPPSDCNASFDPYSYTSGAVAACGYATHPLSSVQALPGGGSAYVYDEGTFTVKFYVPPAGFNPSSATSSQLDEYGFPSLPADLAEAARLQGELNNWKGTPVPPPFLASSNTQSDSVDFYNWSGYAITGDNGDFTQAETWYYEPEFYNSECSSTAETTWAGLGGYYGNNDSLGQDGTSHNVPGIGDHQAWWEVLGNLDMQPINFYATKNYEFDASTKRITDGYRFYMYNYQTQQTAAFDVTGSGVNYYSGDSAEAIAERPKINGTLSYLSNFETLQFLASRANNSGFENWSGSGTNPPRHGIHMYAKVSGNDLADPSNLGTDGAFTVTQNHCQ